MKFRILPNLLEVMIKRHYHFVGVEDLLINQVLNVSLGMEVALDLDKSVARAGWVNSDIITGPFIIPVECLDRIPLRG